MNQRVVLGLLIAGGLGIGLFAAVERIMRQAGRQVVKLEEPPMEPVVPVTLVSKPTVKPEGPAAPLPAGGTRPAPVVAAQLPPAEPPKPVVVLPKGTPVVEKLAVCLGVKDRNPVNETTTVSSKSSRIYCWMRLASGSGKKVRPVWTLNGKITIGAWITIGSNSFRTWTTKRIDAASVGEAKLEIQDEKGRVLATKEFTVVRK